MSSKAHVMRISKVTDKRGTIQCRYDPYTVNQIRAMPGQRKWDAKRKVWVFELTRRNVLYLADMFSDAVFDDGMAEMIRTFRELGEQERLYREAKHAGNVPADDFAFKTKPFEHQRKAFYLSRDRDVFALFMEQGTGKSKIIVDTIAWLYAKGEIDAVLIVSPNSVKSNWALDELPTHMPDNIPYRVAVWDSRQTKAVTEGLDALWSTDGALPILVMNVEAFSRGEGAKFAEKFVTSFMRPMMVVDESTRIKNPSANRTKNIVAVGRRAAYRRILTGTPVTKAPLDVYAQMMFLDEHVLGFGSYYTFRNHFAVMGGYDNKEIVAYKNLDELHALVDAHSFRVLKKDCLDLPEKIYQKAYTPLTPEQELAYRDMRKKLLVEFEDFDLQAKIPLSKLLRLQQIIGGFVPDEEGVIHTLPSNRIGTLMDILEDVDGKVIVWARFTPEIQAITDTLRDKYGHDSAAAFYGAVKQDERTEIRKRFQDPDDPLRFFVGNPSAGGIGLTLTAANTVVYYSNDFSLESRLQSEDRAHRIGQTGDVVYIDIVAQNTIDEKIIRALREKRELASLITKDKLEEWI